MNDLRTWAAELGVDEVAWLELLVKTTLVLIVARLLHASLWRANPRWQRLLWRTTALGVPLVAAWIVARGVLHPARKQEDHGLEHFDLPAEEVSFPGRDGIRLAGWFIPAAGSSPSPTVVLAHGWSRSRAEVLPHADFFHRAGFSVLLFDQRNRGESDGNAVTVGLLEQHDLAGALDYVASRPDVDSRRIGVFGMSTGGVVALLVAAGDERVRAIVAESPFASIETIMNRSLRHYFHLPSFPIAPLTKWVIERRLGGSLDSVQAQDVVEKLSPRPILIIANERDAVVGSDESLRVFEAAGEPKQFWLVPEADHACGWQAAAQEYESRVVAFLRESLGAAEASPARAKRRSRD